jgi:hypothetical protein
MQREIDHVIDAAYRISNDMAQGGSAARAVKSGLVMRSEGFAVKQKTLSTG